MRQKDFTVIEERDTSFGKYTVSDGEYNGRPARVLFSEGGVPQSGTALDDEPDQLFFYTQRFMEIALSIKPDNALCIGGGAFTVPTALARQLAVSTDAVELNPELVDIASRYFNLATPEDGLRVHVADGADFIAGSSDIYDLIILDAFSDRSIPERLISSQAIADYFRLVGENGILAINCISRLSYSSNTLLKGLIPKLEEVFAFVEVYQADTSIDPRSDQNLIIVASSGGDRMSFDYLQSYKLNISGQNKPSVL